jgi:hypothetical protein
MQFLRKVIAFFDTSSDSLEFRRAQYAELPARFP